MTVEEFLDQTDHEFTNIQNFNLQELDLTDRGFEGCTFIGVNFQTADLSRSRFVDCKFKNCDLSNVKVARTNFRDCKFEGSKLVGIEWTTANELALIHFSDCELRYSNFSRLKLKKAEVFNCRVRECDFTDSDFSGSTFKECDFQGTVFGKTNLSKCDFTYSINIALNPKDNNLVDAKIPMQEALGMISIMGVKVV